MLIILCHVNGKVQSNCSNDKHEKMTKKSQKAARKATIITEKVLRFNVLDDQLLSILENGHHRIILRFV